MDEYELFARECMKQIAVRGWTQSKAADMSGASLGQLNRLLNGQGNISARRMFDLARTLGIDLGAIQKEAAS